MGKFANSWGVTKATFAIMRQDSEIFAYPILASIISILTLAILFVLGFIAYLTSSSGSLIMVFYIFLFVIYFFLAFINTFFRMATSYTAATRFSGGNATMKTTMKFCFSRKGTITLWALVQATVGLILHALENSKGKGGVTARIVASILGMAWKIVTVFVIPVMVYENLKPFPAIKESVNVLKKTWGESIIKWAGVHVIKSTANFVAFLLFFVPAFILFFMGSFISGLFMLALWILVTVLVTLILGIANEVYNTALYVYAKTGVIPTGYSEVQLKNSFKVKE